MHVCHGCDTPLEPDDRFCGRCGEPVVRADRGVAVASAQPVRNDPATGLQSLEATLITDRSDAGRLTLAAFQRLREGEADDALLAAESAVALDPRLWSAHLIAGVARNQRGETEHAEAHLQDALRAEPMALHHKATLERLLAAASPRRILPARLLAVSARITSIPAAAWAAAAAVAVLFVGSFWIGTSLRHSHSAGARADYRNVGDLPPGPALQPAAQAYPTPVPRTTYTPPPSVYTPPAASAYAGTRPSAPPPIPYGGAEAEGGGPQRTAAVPPLDTSGPFLPLPPARPDVSGLPDLSARRREPAGGDAAPRDPTPWTRPGAADRTRDSAVTPVRGNPLGSGRVGFEPAANFRPNLPPPSDAVSSSASIQPAPAAPRPAAGRAADGGGAPVADASAPRSEAPAPHATGRSLQSQARRFQNAGRYNEAAQAYRDAIDAYQAEIAAGRSPRAAEYGIAASRAALDLLGAP